MEKFSDKVTLNLETDTLVVSVSGVWNVQDGRPDIEQMFNNVMNKTQQPLRRVIFKDTGILDWDSALPVFIRAIMRICEEEKISVDIKKLPEGVVRLLKLAVLSPRVDILTEGQEGFLEKVGSCVLLITCRVHSALTFVGEVSLAIGNLMLGRGIFRRKDFLLLIEACGAFALPIVGLISFLVGLIMAFVGAVQLAPFGADIYVANLVGVAMVREMGAIMCAMVMAGRTGAAYAAQIGSMKVTEEIDALKTQGISPMEFLVVPRVFSLLLMMPLLCVFSDIIGILGGMIVTVSMLDVTMVQYITQTAEAITGLSFMLGILKSGVFGVIIACSGCLRGMQCGNSSSSVGDAATSAVVTSITLIVIADAIFAVTFNVLKI